ncbi:SDR family NAD(P)-dependent oxidoreductase [Leucobacter sp. GX24907]
MSITANKSGLLADELAGTTVLVTGSSRGIGRATAELLHARGANIIVHARSTTPATEELLTRLGGRSALVLGDLASPGGANEVWQRSVDAFGGVDVLVNNAGAWIASELSPGDAWREGWDANLQLNLTAPADLCRSALLHFGERARLASGEGAAPGTTRGIIINLASRSSHRGDDAEHLAYGAAKGGLLALTRGIARGYAQAGVLAYAVAPGWVATDLADGAIEDSVLAALPLGEVTPPQDVAETIAWLATGRARHATGTTIDITGADYVR